MEIWMVQHVQGRWTFSVLDERNIPQLYELLLKENKSL